MTVWLIIAPATARLHNWSSSIRCWQRMRGSTTLTTHSIGLNGGAITDGSKDAVTTMADTSLALPGPIQDDTPDAFAFTDVTDQALSTIITSNTVTISGIGPAPVAVSVTGDGSPRDQH